MILETDFLTHWKTNTLILELNDQCAPIYIIALWIHCQTRKSVELPSSNNAIKAICRYQGDADNLVRSLKVCGFIDEIEGRLFVHGWAEANAKLVANWKNGSKGGRNPKETQQKPKDNPSDTEKEPKNENSNLGPLGKVRLDQVSLEEEVVDPFEDPSPTKARPSSLEEVIQYAIKINLKDPKNESISFLAHHKQRGWKYSNGQVCVDWKSALVTWKKMKDKFDKRDEQKTTTKQKPSIPMISKEDYLKEQEKYRKPVTLNPQDQLL